MAQTMIAVSLDSGAQLEINAAPFADSHALYKACLKELKSVQLTASLERIDVLKSVLCASFSSPEIEAALWKCFERARIDGKKITRETFEDEKLRGDFVKVCFEVGKVNVEPFLKGLFAEFQTFLSILGESQQ